ncbi:uncharacterized protein [Typha angustifolia]|uniref:uncharacterized protein n=1 Tax=Typha angustifolia TaxID=59011 RepID=UPI003C2C6529
MAILAGMLAGVKGKRRRRRLCQDGSTEAMASSRTMQRSNLYNELRDWDLGSIAREAKERLDEKFKRHHSTCGSSGGSKSGRESGSGSEGGDHCNNLRREVFSSKKSMRKFSWSKLGWGWGWKEVEQAECAVCLEEFKLGDVLVHLPCDHRFHWSCAAPWLQNSSYCPFCRMTVK